MQRLVLPYTVTNPNLPMADHIFHYNVQHSVGQFEHGLFQIDGIFVLIWKHVCASGAKQGFVTQHFPKPTPPHTRRHA